ncbi:MAG: glycosyltransferase family 39 protein [Candidatus Omnitrophota bacterium]|nr:MAG: glycosyltransferase family 39 protein [Candidatus Omnitrophota bacterium]
MLKRQLSQRRGMLLFVLVIFSLAALFVNLEKRSFWEPDEGRYAEISREMLESGDWLTPRLNYIKHLDKPPITYWLIGSSFRLFGQNEFAGHLPLVILAFAGVLAVYSLAKETQGARTAFLSAIILISTLGYPALARVLSTDIILSSFCLFSYLFFVRKKYFLFYLSLALGFMTKGPIILLLVLLPIFIFLIYTKQTYIFKEMRLVSGAVIFAVVGLPWFIYQILIHKGLSYNWLMQQTVSRIATRGEEPFYFFVPVLIGLFFPWIFFLSPALKRYLSFKRTSFDKEKTWTLLLFLWFLVPFIFFSCIGKKLVPYILPLLAPLAVITGRLWDETMDNPAILSEKFFSVSYYIFLSCKSIMLIAMLTFLYRGIDYQLDIPAARPNIIALCIILAGSITASVSFFRLKKPQALFWTVALTSALFFHTAIDVLPKIEADISKSVKPLALKIKQDLTPEDKIVNYRCFLKSLPFYLSRRTIVIERSRHLDFEENEHWQDYLLKDKNDLYRLLSSRKTRIFCITYTWEFEKIKAEYSGRIYLLGKAGKYVLFSNQMRPKLTE